jgi:hypothetical protein
MKRRSPWILVGVLLAWTVAASVSIGKPMWVKKAKELGYPARNCQYCHTVMLPKKDKAKEELNERGKWLVEQKDKHKAKEVDLAWLKDYPGGKEQK